MKMCKFKLSQLFDISTTISQNKNAITFNENGKYDFIGRSSVNYGVQGHLDRQSFPPNPSNTFSLVQVGESVCLYREKEWYASQNIVILKAKDIRLMNNHLYVSTLINKQLSIYSIAYEYPILQEVKDIVISLPMLENSDKNHEYTIEDINFKYMENYISQLEAVRISQLETYHISQLEAYLSVTGLDDYELTNEDREVLGRKVEMRKFRIDEVFKKLPLKNKSNFNKSEDVSRYKSKEFNLPLVNAKHGENGIMYYGRDSEYKSAVMTLGIINDGAISTGDVNPHPEPTGVLYNAYLIKPFYKNLNREILEYLSCVVQKAIKTKFGYNNKATWAKVSKINIMLPITSHASSSHTYTIEDIDFDYMEKYIRAIEKQSVKEICEKNEKVLEKTKTICYK